MDFTKLSFSVSEPISTTHDIPPLALYEISDLELALIGGGIGDVVPA
jgi:hypothetical protein